MLLANVNFLFILLPCKIFFVSTPCKYIIFCFDLWCSVLVSIEFVHVKISLYNINFNHYFERLKSNTMNWFSRNENKRTRTKNERLYRV